MEDFFWSDCRAAPQSGRIEQNSVFGYSGSKSGVARVRHAVEGDITDDASNFRGV